MGAIRTSFVCEHCDVEPAAKMAGRATFRTPSPPGTRIDQRQRLELDQLVPHGRVLAVMDKPNRKGARVSTSSRPLAGR
jgi:hypothetical protein